MLHTVLYAVCIVGACAFSFADHAQATIDGVTTAASLIMELNEKDASHLRAGGKPFDLVFDSRPVFKLYLSSLRHLLAFFAPTTGGWLRGRDLDTFLARAGELEEELSQMVFLGKSEPLFWWSGPKRHVPAKFEELFSLEIDGKSVRAHLASPPAGIKPAEVLQKSENVSVCVDPSAEIRVEPDYEDSFGVKEVLFAASNAAKMALRDNTPTQTGTLSDSIWADLVTERQAFWDNLFIQYKPNFFNKETYKKIMEEIRRLWGSSTDLEPNCNMDGSDRIGGYVLDGHNNTNSLYKYFYENEEFRQWVSRVNGHLMFPSDFPIELREYPISSSGLVCHTDFLMYTNATLDIEILYTADNHGDCTSSFIDRFGKNVSVRTEPNSLLILRPEAAYHCIRKTIGSPHRTILKMIYIGDYRKSRGFWMHANNECGDTSNARQLRARRVKPQSKPAV